MVEVSIIRPILDTHLDVALESQRRFVCFGAHPRMLNIALLPSHQNLEVRIDNSSFSSLSR